MVTNRTSTPMDATGSSLFVGVVINYYFKDINGSPASSTNSGETLVASVPSTLYGCLDRYVLFAPSLSLTLLLSCSLSYSLSFKLSAFILT